MSTNNPYGQVNGYDQFAPGRDVPNASRAPRSSALQSAILDQAPDAPEAPQAAQQPSATSYPADPGMTAFANRQPGPQPPIVRAYNASQTAASGAPTTSTGGVPPPSDGAYAPVGGFALEKIQNPNHVNDKYSPDLRWFSQALAATGAQPGDEGLQNIVNWINQNGGQASANRDMLTINGDTPVDTLVDYNPGKTDYPTGWAYQNNQQAAQQAAPQAQDPLTMAILALTQQNDNASFSDRTLQSLLPSY